MLLDRGPRAGSPGSRDALGVAARRGGRGRREGLLAPDDAGDTPITARVIFRSRPEAPFSFARAPVTRTLVGNVKFNSEIPALFLLTTSALLAGCSEAEVSKADVEQSAMKQLSATVGKQSPTITCPTGLKAKVGTKLVCSMPINDKPYDVTVTVTHVEGTDVKYDVEVADKPHG